MTCIMGAMPVPPAIIVICLTRLGVYKKFPFGPLTRMDWPSLRSETCFDMFPFSYV